MVLSWGCSHGEFADERAVSPDLIGEMPVADGIKDIQPRGQYGNCLATRRHSGLMCEPVDAQRKAADHRPPRSRRYRGKFSRSARPVKRRFARADNR